MRPNQMGLGGAMNINLVLINILQAQSLTFIPSKTNKNKLFITFVTSIWA